MGLVVKSQGGNFEPIEGGTYQAVCYSLIDLGTQHSEFNGKARKLRKVLLGWEIPELRIDVEKEGKKVSMPRVISKIYTLSLHEKSQLYKDLVSWRGRPFTAAELEGFDLFTILKANCLLQVINETKNGKTYAYIASISKLMRGMAPKQPENEVVYYSMDDHAMQIPANVPEWVLKIIQKSDEYLMVEHAKGVFNPETAEDSEENPTINDDIPF